MPAHSAKLRHPVTGQRFVVSARTAAELGAYRHRVEQLRTDLRLGMRTPAQVDAQLRHLRHGPVSLERVYRAYMQRTLSPNTRRGMLSWWRELAGELHALSFAELDAPRVLRWLEGLGRRGMAASSVNAAWRKLSALGAYACGRGWLTAAPWGSWRPKKIGGEGREVQEFARDAGELAAILEAARRIDAHRLRTPGPAEGLRLPPALAALGRGAYDGLEAKIACAALLGLRQGELAGLRWTDIDWGNASPDSDRRPMVVRVARQWDGRGVKGRKAASLEAIDAVRVALNLHAMQLRTLRLYADRGPVFPHPDSTPEAIRPYRSGEPLRRGDVRAVIRSATLPRPTEVGAWSAHSLRATFVTLECLASGGDLRRLQRRTRHASLASLVRYLRMLSATAPAAPLLDVLPRAWNDATGALLPPPQAGTGRFFTSGRR